MRLAALALLWILGPGAEGDAPTFCVEWVEQSSEGFERLTLFSDRTLVWKRRRGNDEHLQNGRFRQR